MNSEAVKAAYKKTEVGMIPEDWDVKKIEDFTNCTSGGTPSTTIETYWGGHIRWMSSGELHMKIVSDVEGRITEEGLKKSSTKIIPKKCILVGLAGQGKTRGTVAINQIELCTNQSIAAILPNSTFKSEYLYYNLDARYNELREISTGAGGRGGLNLSIIKSIPIPLPNKDEQIAIATVLSDADALITSLDRLIAKKRDIKLAAMQELLTGKKKLPEFCGEWETLNMANDSVLKARIGWQGLTTAEYKRDGDYYLVTGTDFLNGKIEWNNCFFVDKQRYTQDKNIQLKIGDILLTKDGTIGKVGYVDRLPKPATLNSGVFVIRPKNDKYNPCFLFYILTSRIFDEFLAKLQAGSTISHLYQKDFVSFSFLAPSKEQQTAIATVLSDMDAEITKLEEKRDKARMIKEGMMQELLTGRIRLVGAEAECEK